MAFQYLSNDVVGKQYIARAWQNQYNTTADPSGGGQYYTTNPGSSSPGGLYGQLFDQIDSKPTFDNAHAVYVPSTQTGTSGKQDNTNGLNPTGQAFLQYSAEKGATATHDTSSSITAGVSEEVDLDFGVASSKTTFNISGTFSYTDGTSTSKTETITNGVNVTIGPVPEGRIYEATIFLSVEQLTVPYTMSVSVPDQTEGNPEILTWANFSPPANGISQAQTYPSTIFGLIGSTGAAGSDSRLYSGGALPEGGGTGGLVTLSGKALMSDFGAYETQVHDVTNQFSGAVAAVDEASGVGVHRTLGDGGEEFTGSKFDDWIEGGAGADRLFLRGGDDRAEGKGGEDYIEALDGGRNVLDGGDGSDHLLVLSDQAYNELRGGGGDDLMEAYAPNSILTGGAGDDTFVMDARGAGSVIVGGEGQDRLLFSPGGRVVLERVGQDLFLHADGDAGSYDPAADLAWLDFFAGDGAVNGLRAADIAAQFDLGGVPAYAPETGAWSVTI